MEGPRIELHHVSKFYGPYGERHGDRVVGLFDVSLAVAPGELLLVTGPTGAGKTTLLKMIYAAESPDEGEVRVAGRDISRLDPSSLPFLRRNVGVVFQESRLVADRSVAENVAIALEVRGLGRRQVQRRVGEALEWVGLSSMWRVKPGLLCGGERQRVAIARALVGDPAILVADEPTLHLDGESAREVMRLLVQAQTRGTTVLLATHDPRAAAELCQPRILTLVRGRVLAPGAGSRTGRRATDRLASSAASSA